MIKLKVLEKKTKLAKNIKSETNFFNLERKKELMYK